MRVAVLVKRVGGPPGRTACRLAVPAVVRRTQPGRTVLSPPSPSLYVAFISNSATVTESCVQPVSLFCRLNGHGEQPSAGMIWVTC